MKKFSLPIITLIFIIGLTCFKLSLNTTMQVTSKAEIEVVRQDSNLDILVNLGDFSKENFSERKLLDVAMQCADKLSLTNELANDYFYFQYVNKDDIHNLIYELTGIIIEKPIEIEDFYYLYDTENSFYYYLGSSPTYYNISEIKNVERIENKYHINCSIQKNVDGELITEENVFVTLIFKPENSIIKYQVEEITINKE